MEHAEPLIRWPDPLIELLGFVASFLAVGAVGFRLRVIARATSSRGSSPEDRDLLRRMSARAAWWGFLGAAVSAALFVTRLPNMAARQHVTVAQLFASRPQTDVQAALLLAAAIGLVLAARSLAAGWALAAAGVIVGPLSGALFGQWNRLVVPMHRLAAGMWIGTLFMLVTTGIAMTLRSPLATERRGALVADLVNAFSPLALVSAGVLATFGVVTAWQHLHTLSALWTTPYGVTLMIKLVMVAIVLALGAWNWRRQKPRLGSAAGAVGLRGTATRELMAAGVVLVISAILVSLPSPRPPRAPGAGPPRVEAH